MTEIAFPGDSDLRTLKRAMRLTSPTGNGLCIHRSVAMVLDVPGSELVFGVFHPDTTPDIAYAAYLTQTGQKPSTVPFVHAWVEHRGVVFAPTTIERMNGQLIPQNREGYYRINGAKKIKRLGRGVVQALVSEHLLLPVLMHPGTMPPGNISFGQVFLDAANMKTVDLDGGIVPA